MRRRLDLAAALVSAPPVLLLDEPTTGLDPRSRNDLWDVIRELVADGTSVLLTTQYLEEADVLAQNIMVIDSGRVIAEGTATKLKEHFGTSVLELAFADEVQAACVRVLLSDDYSVDPPEPGGLVMQVAVEDPVAGTMGVTRILDSAGLVPTRLALREPSLDDVFLALTGHKAEAEPEPAGGKRGRRGRGGKGAS
jgi:ABC-2 type transport system ATP-binding protein